MLELRPTCENSAIALPNHNFLGTYPASTAKHEHPVDLDAHRRLRDRIGTRPPDQR
jgi:hypothetical protein